MNKPMTRRGCLFGVVAWLLVMTLPLLAVLLAMRGEIGWRRGPFVEDRLWLVNLDAGPGGERASGLAYSAARLSPHPAAGPDAICVRTRVYFFLWRGTGEPADYCECFRPEPGGTSQSLGNCP
jgi:hypothetical protein